MIATAIANATALAAALTDIATALADIASNAANAGTELSSFLAILNS